MLAVSSVAVTDVATNAIVPIAVVVGAAVMVLVFIACDLRRLRRDGELRAVHGVMTALFTAVVVAGTLSMTMTMGSVPSATAVQPHGGVPAHVPVNTIDATDPATDIQLPTLPLD